MAKFMRLIAYILVLLGVMWMALGIQINGREYIRGKYGNFCYSTSSYPKTIKNPVYFSTIERCLQSLSGN